MAGGGGGGELMWANRSSSIPQSFYACYGPENSIFQTLRDCETLVSK